MDYCRAGSASENGVQYYCDYTYPPYLPIDERVVLSRGGGQYAEYKRNGFFSFPPSLSLWENGPSPRHLRRREGKEKGILLR